MESTSVTQIERILYFLELPQQLRPRPLIRQCGSYSPKTASKNVSLPCLLFLTSRVGFILSRSLNSVSILWLPGPIECSKRGYFGKPNFGFLTLGGLNHDVKRCRPKRPHGEVLEDETSLGDWVQLEESGEFKQVKKSSWTF